MEETTTLWSDPASWPALPNRIPVEGEEVIILSGLTIIYDIGTSPIFKKVEVNGNLSFLYGQPAVLRTYGLWVRAGTMTVGTESAPFDSTVEIRLHGVKRDETPFIFSKNISPGNKNIIVTGTLNMFG